MRAGQERTGPGVDGSGLSFFVRATDRWCLLYLAFLTMLAFLAFLQVHNQIVRSSKASLCDRSAANDIDRPSRAHLLGCIDGAPPNPLSKYAFTCMSAPRRHTSRAFLRQINRPSAVRNGGAHMVHMALMALMALMGLSAHRAHYFRAVPASGRPTSRRRTLLYSTTRSCLLLGSCGRAYGLIAPMTATTPSKVAVCPILGFAL